MGEDAQCIADLLSVLLHEDDAFVSEEGRRFYGLLKCLVKSAEVLPQCYKLEGLQCDFSQAREGGGFADIYEGEYRERKVCVKAVRIFQKEDNSRMIEAFAKEIVLWAHLSHGNILPFYGVHIQQTSGRICIISPWMDRGDLCTHLKNFPDTPRLPLVRDIIAGLRYLHASNIVHGDLKANNVLVSDKGHALLADFGISCLLATTKVSSNRLSTGTLRWMAPELLVEGKSPTLESDMWSFGCVCYEVFTRTCEIPFDELRDHQIYPALDKQTRTPGDAQQLGQLSSGERALMEKCWKYEPDLRPSCEEIYESVVDQIGERVNLEVPDVALWKAVRDGSGMTVNYARAHRILGAIQGHPHDYIPSFSDPGSKSGYVPNNSFLGGNNPEAIRAIEAIRKDDIIIAFMGPTGAGKSYFIDLLTGQKGQRASNSLKSATSQIQATRVRRQGHGDRIVLVDTPGFDDTYRSDLEVLQIISDWLQKTYSKQVILSGIIYLHRITDNRLSGSPHKNLRMFGELCGDVAMTQVRLVTTMWRKVDPEVGAGRERELQEQFWKRFIEKGLKTERLRDTTGEEAWRIVDRLIGDSKTRDAVLLQEELVDLDKQLNETAAGRTLYSSLQRSLAEQKDALRSLLMQVEKSDDPNLTKELKREYARIYDGFQRTFQEVAKLKVPIGRRIVLFFFGKKTRAKAIKIPEE